MSKLSFQARFLLPVSITIALAIVGSALLIAYKAASREDAAAREDAQRLAQATQTMLAVTETLMAERVKGAMRLLRERAAMLGTASLGTATTQVGEKAVPMLLLGGKPQVGNFDLVDNVTTTLGGTATLFVKSGDEFVRVSTNVKKADGSRAIGTILDPNGKAIAAIRNKQAFYGVVDILGNPFITGYEPMLDSAGELVGIWYVGYKAELQAVKEKIEAQRFLTSGFLAVVDGKDKVRFRSSHVEDAAVEKLLKEPPPDWTLISEAIPGWGFKAVIAYPQSEAEAVSRTTALQILVFGLVLTGVLLGVIAALLKGMVLKPLGGDPAAALSAVRRISGGDLRDDREIIAPTGSLLGAMVEMRHALRDMVSSIDAGAIRLADSAATLVATSESVAEAASHQTDATASIAATLEEITVSIRHVANSAESANGMARNSGELSTEGQGTVGRVMNDMRGTADNVNAAAGMVQQLGESSNAISSIVNVIKEIADQTNLLALNAAIEAARAGEQGRGFAVVADEVRKLAERTTQSTQEITRMIDEIQQRTGNVMEVMSSGVERVNTSVASVQAAGDSMARIRESAMGVISAFNEISVALKEQSEASEQISRSVENVASRNEENSVAVHHLTDAAHQLNTVAADLRQAVERFKV